VRILLINPPNTNELIANDTPQEVSYKGVFPNLGLMYLASAVKDLAEVKIADCQVDGMDITDLKKILFNYQPDVVGLTAMTFTLIDVKQVIDAVRLYTKAKIILGGPHVAVYPDRCFDLNVDYAIVGEGEIKFREIIETLLRGEKPPKLLTSEKLKNLDNLIHPLREVGKNCWGIMSNKPITTMITSRGCPFGCHYCDRPAMGRNFRMRSPMGVVDEIEECLDLGINEIVFYDDTFTVNRDRAMGICELILKRGLKLDWSIRARVDTVDYELLKTLKRAGCYRIHFGVESGSNKVLKNINKGITVEQARNAFKWAHQNKIDTLAYFMIGMPGETKEDMDASLKLAKELKTYYAKFTIFTPFPGTETYKRWLERGNPDVWASYVSSPTKDFQPPIWGDYSREELQTIVKKIYKNFYGRPTWMLHKLFKVRSISEFTRLCRAGYQVLCK
jgi:anaerobic magnesium-protoporphyrin IX monomethyl ester cyclase